MEMCRVPGDGDDPDMMTRQDDDHVFVCMVCVCQASLYERKVDMRRYGLKYVSMEYME
jgi:hypothetical protein